MSRRERENKFDSILIDKEFLTVLVKIIDDNNPNDISMRTEITVQSERGKDTFENLNDFIESLTLPQKIKSLSIKKNPYNKKEKKETIQFFLNIENPNNSYYRLIGYDEGKLSTCKRQLETIFNKHKNWYYFLYKIPIPEGTIPLLMSISFVIFLWKFLPDLPYTEEYRETYNVVVLGIGGFFWYVFHKFYNFLFPFFDFQINRTRRSNWLVGLIGLVSLGLLVNIIWKLIQVIFN